METAHYKQFTTSRALTYTYYLREPRADGTADQVPNDPLNPFPALLFLHGFPTSSCLWKHQVTYFHQKGFVVCAPDLLGFGHSAKPYDTAAYRASLVCKDIIEILDRESLDKLIVVGHDLGSKIASRLANFYPKRFVAYAFLAVPYSAPRPKPMEFSLKLTKKMCGYELYGHISFYAEADAEIIIQKHLESFFCAMFPSDPKLRATQVAPVGALRSWLGRDAKTRIPAYAAEEILGWKNSLCQNGRVPALCWYKALVSELNMDDDNEISKERYSLHQPVFFAAAIHDYISLSILGTAITNYHCKNATIREILDGHWLMLSSPDEVNAALFSWIMDHIQ